MQKAFSRFQLFAKDFELYELVHEVESCMKTIRIQENQIHMIEEQQEKRTLKPQQVRKLQTQGMQGGSSIYVDILKGNGYIKTSPRRGESPKKVIKRREKKVQGSTSRPGGQVRPSQANV